jgi:hypothetical protein
MAVMDSKLWDSHIFACIRITDLAILVLIAV